MTLNDIFARLVFELRAARAVTVRKLASKAGIDRSTVSMLELGRENVSPRLLEKVMRGLDIPIDRLPELLRQIMDGVKREEQLIEEPGHIKTSHEAVSQTTEEKENGRSE